jgi:hypothetical protein
MASDRRGGTARPRGLWVFNGQACERARGHDDTARRDVGNDYDDSPAPDDDYRRSHNHSDDRASHYGYSRDGRGWHAPAPVVPKRQLHQLRRQRGV